MFHKIKGKNVTLDETLCTATWNPVQSGGLAFTDRPLNTNGPVRLTLSGTGAVELGITWCDPASLSSKVPESASKLDKYNFLNDVKIHKRSCTMCITLDDKTQEVISSYGGGQYRQTVDCENNYWLVVDVKYGNIELELKNSESQNLRHQFSEVCGSNIKLLNDPSCAGSRRQSPGALCFSDKPVSPGQQYVIHCSPRGYQGTIPGRYYLLLRYTKLKPEDFSAKFEAMFDLHKRADSLSSVERQDWKEIEKFEKEDCTGNPVEVEYTGTSFVYKSSSGKRSSQNCRGDNESKIWLVFELYGVSVKLEVFDANTRRADSSACQRCNRSISSIPEVSNEVETRISKQMSESMLEVTDQPEPPSPSSLSDPFSPRSLGASCRGHEHLSGAYIDDPVSLEKAIQKNFTKLRDNFIVNEFLDHMFENDLLSRNEYEQLEQQLNVNKVQVTKKALLILSSRPVSKKFMLMALEKTRQQFLIPLFFPEEEKE